MAQKNRKDQSTTKMAYSRTSYTLDPKKKTEKTKSSTSGSGMKMKRELVTPRSTGGGTFSDRSTGSGTSTGMKMKKELVTPSSTVSATRTRTRRGILRED